MRLASPRMVASPPSAASVSAPCVRLCRALDRHRPGGAGAVCALRQAGIAQDRDGPAALLVSAPWVDWPRLRDHRAIGSKGICPLRQAGAASDRCWRGQHLHRAWWIQSVALSSVPLIVTLLALATSWYSVESGSHRQPLPTVVLRLIAVSPDPTVG